MRKILVADDSSTIRKVVDHALTGASMRVIQASEGREALLAAERERPELILCDTGLPGLSGYELAARVREHEQLAGTPVVLMRGAFERFDEQRACDCGAAGALEKPFSLETLVETVQRVLAETPPRPAPPPPAAAVPAIEEERRPAEPVRVTRAHLARDEEDAPLDVESLSPPPVDMEEDEQPLGPLGPDHPVDAPLPGEPGFAIPGSAGRGPDADRRAIDADELAEEIRRQVAGLAPGIIREIAWEIVPDLLERLLREARNRDRTTNEAGDPDR